MVESNDKDMKNMSFEQEGNLTTAIEEKTINVETSNVANTVGESAVKPVKEETIDKKVQKKQAQKDNKAKRIQAKKDKKQEKKQKKKEAWKQKTVAQKILSIFKRILLFAVLLCVIGLVIYMTVFRKCTFRFIKVEDYDGRIKVSRDFADSVSIFRGMLLQNEDKVEVREDGFLEMLVDSDKHIVATGGTVFTVNAVGTSWFGGVTVNIEKGSALFTIDNKLNSNSTFEVVTPNACLSVRGTTFDVSYNDRKTLVYVEEGSVALTVKGKEYMIEPGEIYEITSRDVRNLSDLSAAKTGDIVYYGFYEQDGDKNNGKEPIEWMVINENDGKLMLLSVKGLEQMQYSDSSDLYSWEDSKIRRWLNNDFYNEAFSDEERENIVLTAVENTLSEWDYGYSEDEVAWTDDYIYILSFTELQEYMEPSYVFNFGFYFGYTQEAICAPTDALIASGIDTYYFEENRHEDYNYTDDCIGLTGGKWWLRTPSQMLLGGVNMWSVNGDGGWNDDTSVLAEDIMVRPVMWVEK